MTAQKKSPASGVTHWPGSVSLTCDRETSIYTAALWGCNMIRMRNGAYGLIAKLECDSCGAELRYCIAVVGDDKPNHAQVNKLRDEAQKAGWLHVLIPVRSAEPRDQCPKCFTMPPEG